MAEADASRSSFAGPSVAETALKRLQAGLRGFAAEPGRLRLRNARTALSPHWGVLLALALFLAVGLVVLDDYGVSHDERRQREIAVANLRYVAGDTEAVFALGKADHLYGAAWEAALLLAEPALGLESSRAVHLSRHLLTHLFFLAGGLFAYLLALRITGNRAVALFAALLLLLHPRLYAHSFFNSKDIPFLTMLMMVLYLTRRAFGKETLPAFLLLGFAVGALINTRVAGAAMLAAVPALRALDFALAQGWTERKRVLLTTSAFVLAAALAAFALAPYPWGDPIARTAEWWSVSSAHPTVTQELFMGTTYRSVDFPAVYLTVWIAISSPPFALLLGAVGAGAALAWGIRSPKAALRNTGARFRLMIAGCFALPALGVVLLDVNIYNGWRLMHFLWAPFSLLAAFGLQGLASALRGTRLRAAVYAAAGGGLAAAAVSMALIHPNQQAYFNAFADRTAPERLRTQYVVDTGGHPTRQALEWILERDPSAAEEAQGTGGTPQFLIELNKEILPLRQRERFSDRPELGGYAVTHGPGARPGLLAHPVRVYGNTIASVERKGDLQAAYRNTRGREPLIEGAFDVYEANGGLIVAKEPCAPSFLTETIPVLRITPVQTEALSDQRARKGFEAFRFRLAGYGALLDGACVAFLPLPAYPVAGFDLEWPPFLLDDDDAREMARGATENARPLARSAYDVYLADDELVYVQESCDPNETERPFYLDSFPQRVSDLPEDRRGHGFERSYYHFYRIGGFFDGACVAFLPLPAYPVAAVRTGQRTPEEGDSWSVTFSLRPDPLRAAYRAVASLKPLAQSAFDVYETHGSLVYAREVCAYADTEARFFLHIAPERTSDLPDDRERHGFDNLDFDFFLKGALFDGTCAARVPLPDYPIASIRTGQHVRGEGEIWSAEFAPGAAPSSPLPSPR